MRVLAPVLTLGLLVLAVAALPASAQRTLNVYQGESAMLSLDYQFSKLAVGDPKVADYAVQKNTATGAEILINGKSAGSTNIIVWDAQGTEREQVAVNCLVRDIKALMNQIKALIGPVEGVRYRVAGGKLIIEGQVTTPAEMERIKKVVGDSKQVITMIGISPVSLRIIADTIRSNLGHPSIRVRPVGQKIALEGVVYSKAQRKMAEDEARLYYGDIVNLLEVRKSLVTPGPGDMIQVTANFMEVNNSVIDGWGINWFPLSVPGNSSVTGEKSFSGGNWTGSIVGTITNLFPKLSVAKEMDGARSLETSSMSVRSGDKAYFHSGGEVGIPVAQPSGSVTLQFKKFGIIMSITPVSQGDNISLNLDVEVSAPTSTSAGGYLNFKKSRVQTVQYCKSADSVAIGGLVSNKNTKVYDKLPEGMDDALFQLYTSEDFRMDRSRFVVFVTPAVLRSGATEANQELKGIVEDSFGAYQEKARWPEGKKFMEAPSN